MKFLGNIIWLIFGGLITASGWCIYGVLWCVTIVGIPLGLQCFKFASLSLWPFGKDVEYTGGAFKLIVNIIWIIFTGLEMAIANVLCGLVMCLTIVGIPFGLQFFKLALLSLMPFGSKVEG